MAEIRPFQVDVPDEMLDDLTQFLSGFDVSTDAARRIVDAQ